MAGRIRPHGFLENAHDCHCCSFRRRLASNRFVVCVMLPTLCTHFSIPLRGPVDERDTTITAVSKIVAMISVSSSTSWSFFFLGGLLCLLHDFIFWPLR